MDVLARRPLADTVRAVETLSGTRCRVVSGGPLPLSGLAVDEGVLVDLAGGLPWMRALLRLAPQHPDPAGLFRSASRLGTGLIKDGLSRRPARASSFAFRGDSTF